MSDTVVSQGITEQQIRWLTNGDSSRSESNPRPLPRWADSDFVRLALKALATEIPSEAAERIPAAETLIQVAAQVADRADQIQTYLTCARLQWVCSLYGEARLSIKQARLLAEQEQDWRTVAECYRREGAASQQIGDLREAQRLYEQSLVYFETMSDTEQVAICQFNLGLLLSQMGEPDRALELYTEAEQKFIALQNELYQALCQMNRGTLYSETGRISDALVMFERAQTIFEQKGDLRRAGTCCHQRAGLYGALGKTDEAREMYNQSLKIFEQIGDQRRVALCYLNAAYHIYVALKHLPEALDLYDQALERLSALNEGRGIAACLLRKAEIFQQLNQNDSARACYAQAIESRRASGDKITMAYAQLGLAILQASQGEETQDTLRDLQEIFQEAKDYRGLMSLWKLKGDAHAKKEQWRDALTCYQSAVQQQQRLWLSMTDPLFAATAANPWETLPAQLARAAAHEGSLLPLYPELQRARSSALEGAFSGERSSVSSASLSEIERFTQLQSEYEQARQQAMQSQSRTKNSAELKEKLSLLSAEMNHLESRLRSRAFSPLAAHENPLQAIAQQLDPHEAILEIFMGEGELCLLLIQNQHGKLKIKSHLAALDTNALAQDVSNLTEELAMGVSPQLTRPAARVLYQQLIQPFERALGHTTTLIFCPDSALSLLPFSALIDRSGRYLIEKWVPVLAPSAFTWALAKSRSRYLQSLPAKPPLLVGISRFQNQSASETEEVELVDLPQVKQEVQQIKSHLLGRAKVLLNEQAALESVKQEAQKAGWLHFATHAVSNARLPLMSWLALKADHGDGIAPLYARDICRFQMEAQMAVLSACSSSGGRSTSNEGLLGLSWAFLMAGCPATLSTRWDIADEAAALWSSHFYQFYASGLGTGESFQRACAQMIQNKTFSEPSFWACWQLMGAST